jgi:hypothetical protein
MGRHLTRPGQPIPALQRPRPGYRSCLLRLGPSGQLRLGRDIAPRPGSVPGQRMGQAVACMCRLGCFRAVIRPGQAGNKSPGRITTFLAGLALFWARFIFPGTLPSSGIDSTARCQSWDASGLGLAYPSPSYAGLGTLLSSDQHISPLLVSLILRRRIRLMTW